MQVLIGHGHLDDARFARLFAQDKRELEDWGRDRIARALLRRGLESELVEDALPPAAAQLRIRARACRRFAAPALSASREVTAASETGRSECSRARAMAAELAFEALA